MSKNPNKKHPRPKHRPNNDNLVNGLSRPTRKFCRIAAGLSPHNNYPVKIDTININAPPHVIGRSFHFKQDTYRHSTCCVIVGRQWLINQQKITNTRTQFNGTNANANANAN